MIITGNSEDFQVIGDITAKQLYKAGPWLQSCNSNTKVSL